MICSKNAEFYSCVADNQSNICQVAVIQNGKTIINDTWNGYKANDTVHTMSVTKSVVSLLVGIAVDKGLIGSIDDYVLDYFPDYKIKRVEKTIQKVTLKNLLTMTAPYKYKAEPWSKICVQEDWSIAALDFLGGRRGITGEFQYSTLMGDRGDDISYFFNGVRACTNSLKSFEEGAKSGNDTKERTDIS